MFLPTQKLSRSVITDLVPSDYSLTGLQAHSSQLVILEAADICLFRSFEYSTHYFSKPFFEKVTIAIFDHNPCFDLSCWGSSVFDIMFCSYLVSFPPLCSIQFSSGALLISLSSSTLLEPNTVLLLPIHLFSCGSYTWSWPSLLQVSALQKRINKKERPAWSWRKHFQQRINIYTTM